jgi:hypothetical protein
MKAIEKLNLVNATYKATLQVAREDKPTGDYPEWVAQVEEHFNDLARTYMSQAREEMGIIRAEQAVS